MKIDKHKTEEKDTAQDEALALIQMYQSGFLDGLRCLIGPIKFSVKYQKKCHKAFNMRFMGSKTGIIHNQEKSCNNRP